jgi:serine/threonine-protein kinase
MAENRCPQCNAPNRTSARYCAECGAPLLGGIPESRPVASEAISPLAPGESAPGESLVLINRYRIEKELGRGGFGAVYKAWDLNLNRTCAIKENLDTSSEAQRQFAREASVLANLSHPNLPRVTDHFSIPGQGQYLAMDFVEGQDLENILHQQGLPATEQVLRWIMQVTDALEYLHKQQPPVLHRDIKPANIRITPGNQAMLVDFGLVKLYDPSLKTTMGARAVTPGYAPPEQYGQGHTDARTDLYALGATLYRSLTGQDPMESVQRVVGASLPSVHQLKPRVPQNLSQVIERLMALDPAQRYQSASQLKADLQSIYAQAPIHPQAERPRPIPPTQVAASSPVVSPPRQRPVTPQAVAASKEIAERPMPPRAAPANQSSRKTWLPMLAIVAALGICGVLTVIILGLAFNGPGDDTTAATAAAQQTQAEQINSTSTALALAKQATTTSTQANQLTSTLTPDRIPTTLVKKPLILGLPDWPVQIEENFIDNRNDWWLGENTTSEHFDLIKAEIQNGYYLASLEAKKPNNAWWLNNDNFQTGDSFILSIATHQTAGSDDAWRGVTFRHSDDHDYYLLSIQGSGYFGVWIHQDNVFRQLLPPTAIASVKAGLTSHLAVLGQGANFTFYINGEQVGRVTDATLTAGNTGVYFEVGSSQDGSFETDYIQIQSP